jgi:hypothetical protein
MNYYLNQNFKKDKKMDTSKNFYVGIQDSKNFRRNLLEGSKSLISILRTYHKILHLQKQKQKQLSLLNQNLKEINSLVKHLDEAMPDMGVRASAKNVENKTTHKKIVSKKIEVEPVIPKNSSELFALEQQLKDIDSKLNNL